MFIRRTVIAGIMLAAPLAFAAPAMAGPTIDCSPCSKVPVWEDIWPGGDTKGPWENAFSGGAWEKATGNGPWEKATAGGAWEKVFPPKPAE